ncbi:energy transducer TonB [Pseudoalteromonas sp. G4]|uniref:energy transducer TonB n=1 Tax=Pseudoalteromonas sp. G4 TaxID=2992761 RepID=UPI00237D48B1|nr:energy transducer TonB [Pseudoalteromonas sp. G4]MDE3272470.1 energy transducer TonB [Pseudoalteromonas sp. G4]
MKKLASVIAGLLLAGQSLNAMANADRAMDLYLNQDYAQAFKLFQKTAHLGHGKSQFNLGVQYLRGQGVAQDPILAYAYLAVAIENGFLTARQALKTVERRLTPAQMENAQAKANELIGLYGKNGSENIRYALPFDRDYNPTPKRTENPEAKYPSSLFNKGIPGMARYLFDIDRNGIVRDVQLLQSYPSDEFAESVLDKLENSRYQILKVGGSLRKFSQAQFGVVFKRTDIPEETLKQLEAKHKKLLAQAKRGNTKSQAELADMLELMSDDDMLKVAYLPKDSVASSNGVANLLASNAEEFTETPELSEDFYNFNYLVWLDKQGKTIRYEATGDYKAPKELDKLAVKTMQNWQVLVSGDEQSEYGPFLAEFFYNNEARNNTYSNYINRQNVRLKQIIAKPREEMPSYWRLKAAQGGDFASLMLLGAGCNLRILGTAADLGHTPAQTLAAKCILQKADASKELLSQAREWLGDAAEKGDYIAMRELAGIYARESHNQGELNYAIELTKLVVDEKDDPWAYEYMAAAYAKLGQFDEAVDMQEKAVKEAWDKDYFVDAAKARLAAYENSKLGTW